VLTVRALPLARGSFMADFSSTQLDGSFWDNVKILWKYGYFSPARADKMCAQMRHSQLNELTLPPTV
jgi:hypothetical protein